MIFPWSGHQTSRPTKTSEEAGAIYPLPWCVDSWSPSAEPEPNVFSARNLALAKQKQERLAEQAKRNTECVWKETGHDYVRTSAANISVHDAEIVYLRKKVQKLQTENDKLKLQVFSLDAIKDSDSEFQRYTNLPNYGVFSAISEYLFQRSEGRLQYWRGKGSECSAKLERSKTVTKERTLTFTEEFFLVLVKLKSGEFNQEVARKFGISASQMSKIFTTWINFLHNEFKLLFEMKTSWENTER